MMIVASSRGTTSRRIGEIAIDRSASTCSVTVIEPSSAVMPEPTRPPTMSAVRTGPSSRTSERATTRPTNCFPPNASSEYAVCSASTMPVKSAVMPVIDTDFTPSSSIWVSSSAE